MKIKLFFLFALVLFFSPLAVTHAASTDNLTGYAWSSNIGWVSLNCTNDATCGANSYGANMASDGTITGYAWSPNVGWISFNSADTTGCPSGTCQATYASSTGQVTGWARAVAGEDTNTNDTGSWGGWISLSGTNYSVSIASCKWGGYAWGSGPDSGSGVIGWLSFSGTTGDGNTYGVAGGSGCAAQAPNLQAGAPTTSGSPLAGVAATYSAVISNVGPTTTGAGFKDLFQKATDVSGTGATDIGTYTNATLGGGLSNTATLSYAFPSSGTFYVRACADKASAADAGAITESNEADNCSPWTPVVIASCTPSIQAASPSTVTLGQSSNIVYTEPSACAASCQLSDGSNVKANSGSATTDTVFPTTAPTSSYSVICGSYSSVPDTITVNVPSVTLTAAPDKVANGATSVILNWTNTLLSSPPNACTITRNGAALVGPQYTTITGTNVSDPTAVTSQTLYKISCTTGTLASPGTPVTSQAIVNLAPTFNNF
jgi:hypothetical protein